jgi:excinuclease ABC subunit A
MDSGNTVLVIEHNLDVIKTADYIIDLGPEGGDEGGLVIAEGTPEEVALSGTYTGKFLNEILNGEPLISSIETDEDVISEGSSNNK